MNTFKKAERKQTALKIAITGPSGSGKTFSALLIAAGIGKKIAVVDTENGSASLYAGMDKGSLAGIEFDTLPIEPPYTIQKYVEAIDMAEKAGYDVLLIDGISPAWAGEGGLLEKKDAMDQRGGNSYTNWAGITKEHEQFKARLLTADIHLICTMRSKQDYVLELNAKGKSVPKKVGMAPIQRDGMEYEFTTVLDLAMDHNAIASKDRTSLFDGQIFKPTQMTGKKIMDWLKGGAPITKQESVKAATSKQAEEFPTDRPVEAKPEAKPSGKVLVIKAGIERVQGHGITTETAWKGLGDYIMKIHKRTFGELSELSPAEEDTAIDYLNRWAEHLEAKRQAAAKPNGRKAA
jgi:hypothetical protein